MVKNMKKINIEDREYELIKNYNNGFDEELFKEKVTDYFYDYDYIVGDIAYNKLRMKGFYDSNNKNVSKINNYNDVEKYLINNCASDCKHFIVKKVGK